MLQTGSFHWRRERILEDYFGHFYKLYSYSRKAPGREVKDRVTPDKPTGHSEPEDEQTKRSGAGAGELLIVLSHTVQWKPAAGAGWRAAISCLTLYPKHAVMRRRNTIHAYDVNITFYHLFKFSISKYLWNGHSLYQCVINEHAVTSFNDSPNWLVLQCLRVRTVSAIMCWKAREEAHEWKAHFWCRWSSSAAGLNGLIPLDVHRRAVFGARPGFNWVYWVWITKEYPDLVCRNSGSQPQLHRF